MRLVLAGEIAAGASVQPLTGDVEDFESDVAHRAAAVRRIEAHARHIVQHCLALGLGPVGDQIARRIERRAIIQQPQPERRQCAEPPPGSAIGAAHLEKRLEPDFGKRGRQMVGPVADKRQFSGKCGEAAGEKIAKRLPARVDIGAVAVDEIHRHIEHVVDIALEAEPVLENKRQGAAAVGIGVRPDKAAIAVEFGRLPLDKGRIGEQRHRDRL